MKHKTLRGMAVCSGAAAALVTGTAMACPDPAVVDVCFKVERRDPGYRHSGQVRIQATVRNVGDARFVRQGTAPRLDLFSQRPGGPFQVVGTGEVTNAQQALNPGESRTITSELVPWIPAEFAPRVGASIRYFVDPDIPTGDCVSSNNRREFDGAAIDRALAAAGPDTWVCPAAIAPLPPPSPVTSWLFRPNLNAAGRKLRGFVDLHTHPMAHLGFGGQLVHGAPDVGVDLAPGTLYDGAANAGDTTFNTGRINCNKGVVQARSIEEALGSCRATHGGKSVDGNNCGDTVRSMIVEKSNNGGGHPHPRGHDHPLGAPTFAQWPKFNDWVHQQMWIDWIKRAKDGGLRVMVGLAVNSMTLAAGLRTDPRGIAAGVGATLAVAGGTVAPLADFFLPGASQLIAGSTSLSIFAGPLADFLAKGFSSSLPYDDRFTGYWQVQQLRAMAERHSDWMEVAYSARDLRRIVEQEKLAVILGVELDDIGDFAWTASHGGRAPTDADVVREIHNLYDLGVRYAFPVHVTDNLFGGTAIYHPDFERASRFHFGAWPSTACARPSTGVTLQTVDGLDPVKLLAIGPAAGPLPVPAGCSSDVGYVNTRGLQPLGKVAIKEMMKLGMLIDIDHMSEATAWETIEFTANTPSKDPYPLVSGHNGLRGGFERGELTQRRPGISENSRTPLQYQQIAKRSGVVGIGWAGADARTWLTNVRSAIGAVRAVDDKVTLAINLGSDVNGLSSLPRLPQDATAAGGPCGPSARCVQYSPSFPQATTVTRGGTKTWDYNVEGVAHIGLYPDFLRHVENVGGHDIVDRLFDGAEAFAKMWEAAERTEIAASDWLTIGRTLLIHKPGGRANQEVPMGFQVTRVADTDAFAKSGGRCTFKIAYTQSNTGRTARGAFANRILLGSTVLSEQREAGLGPGRTTLVEAEVVLPPGQNPLIIRLDDGQRGHGVGLWFLDVVGACR